MSTDAPLLLANLGAEETLGGDADAGAPEAMSEPARQATRQAATLWAMLFAADAELLGHESLDGQSLGAETPETRSPPRMPPVWGPPATGPAADWLEAPGAAVAWLVTEAAVRTAAARGRKLQGPDPALVRRVHDKAFGLGVAEREGLVPVELHNTCRVLDADQLADETTTRQLLQAAWADWPEWLRRDAAPGPRATLKPRLGCSGRGRVALDPRAPAALGAAARRLAARGGAIFEPWLTRRQDLSVQLHLAPDGALRMLGSLEPCTTAAGVPRAHRGLVDSRGRVRSGTEWDEALREAAAGVAGAAREAGYHGPCGLDALVFDDAAGQAVLRPVVEWNARFTLGHVVVGGVRRALPFLKQQLGLEPGELRAFEWLWQTPGRGPEPMPEVTWVPFPEMAPGAGMTAGVAFARDAEQLAAWRTSSWGAG